ncbi:MAG: ABC transporter permease, partial [Chloroflexi bacterium]
MPPDSVVSPLQLDPDLTVLAENDLATALSENELKELAEKKEKPATPLKDSLRRLRRDKRAMASIGVIGFLVLLAIFGPFIYQHIGGPYDSALNGTISPQVYHSYYHQELDRQDEGPSAQYWLGTDDLGRDLVLAGFHGGWIDQVLARFTDIIFAFPGLLFIILVAGIFGAWADTHLSGIPIIGANGNARLLLVSLALAFVAWPLMARYVRGQTLQLKEQQFIEAARTAGTSDTRIILRHIVPNLFSIVVVAATLNMVNTIVAEAGISLLGLGVQTPGSSIGLMISQAQN